MRFYFDFISPFAYLANKRVHDLAARHNRAVELVPIPFGVLLDHHGHKGPAEIESKRIYVFKQVSRIAAREGWRLTPPPAHPFNPILALAVASVPGPNQRQIVDTLFDAVWAGGPGVAQVEQIVNVLDAAGLSGQQAVAQGVEGRARVRAQATEAIAAGVFGVPTILVDRELFWGVDAFRDIDAFLGGRDPVDLQGLQRWKDLPVGATRKAASKAE